jgi:hypothetical protein
VRPVVIVADDAAGAVATRCADRCDAAVAAVAEDLSVAGEQVRHGVRTSKTSLRPGPTAADRDKTAGWAADDDLGVDGAPVVGADGGDGLIVGWDLDGVADPRPGVAGGIGLWRWSQHRDQVVNDRVDGGLAGVKQRGQGMGGHVGAPMGHTSRTRTACGSAPGPSRCGGSRWWAGDANRMGVDDAERGERHRVSPAVTG